MYNIIDNHYDVIGEVEFKTKERFLNFLKNNELALEITVSNISDVHYLLFNHDLTVCKNWEQQIYDDNNGALYYEDECGFVLEI